MDFLQNVTQRRLGFRREQTFHLKREEEGKMGRILMRGIICVLFVGVAMGAFGQQKDSDSIGDKIDRGVRDVESRLREKWGDIKQATHRMTVQGRVYARLYWDKSLADSTIRIETKDKGVVVLKGSVPTRDAKRRAVELTDSTVGVHETIDELAVGPNRDK
jgi:osmotically-inducible protein OsmY